MVMNTEPYIVKFNEWNSPIWYKNFVRSLPLKKSIVAEYDQIRSELEKYNATLMTQGNYPSIWFHSEQDYTYFLLRWS